VIILFSITATLILLYLMYPAWLALISPDRKPSCSEEEAKELKEVSVILLSYNGKKYLHDKIDFLLGELSCFEHPELIIIDDKSTDGSAEFLDSLIKRETVIIIHNPEHRGIPYSMNLGIDRAKYECVIFCDQRQELSRDILKKILEPLQDPDVGAVSGCISSFDKEQKCSLLRRHENFLKSRESRTGNLIGVYGPFYAIRKPCYSPIPEQIILDDLYLSLGILRSKKIEIREDCRITDDDLSVLYDYKRARRYLAGFLQLLKEGQMLRDLSTRQKIMLAWHKYLRLLIPPFIFSCYIMTGIMALHRLNYLVLFCIVTAAGLLSVFKVSARYWNGPKNVVRMNILYMAGWIDIFLPRTLLNRQDLDANGYKLPDPGSMDK
jgi:glycosyltransferase involved in cell wall biosynthesis